MKSKQNYIKAVLLLGFIVFLYSFSAHRKSMRKLQNIKVSFSNGENLFITESAVNKLLIQNVKGVKNLSIDTLNLSTLEKKLNKNDMIANAEVYLTVNGELGAEITQRKPIARVFSKESFYIDERGKSMPLSANYSVRVPVLTGVSKKQIPAVFPLLKKIENDAFLKQLVVGISAVGNHKYQLAIRSHDFVVSIGEIEELDRKIKNFKAFYKEASQQGKLKDFKEVNLQFVNQVVCTKK